MIVGGVCRWCSRVEEHISSKEGQHPPPQLVLVGTQAQAQTNPRMTEQNTEHGW